ncbi:DUF1071 domain-containing protein [Limosilactobacillus vaginalis]|uniref:Sak single strand annealing protein n=1 Tax=Limosilactobacillus vaginalis TaxID=1633 RepID=UPI0036070EB1
MTEKKQSVFETLSKIDVSNHVQVIRMKKGPALKYVSWAWAWNMVKSKYPDATRKIEEYPEYQYDKNNGRWYATGQMLDYRITPAGCEVKVTVTIQGEEYSERLYVMDMRNQPVMQPNISQINKTQQRCLVKALAMAGLGLNLYAGEDLPMGDISEKDEKQAEAKKKTNTQQQQAKKPANKQHDNSLGANAEHYKALVDEYAKVTGYSTKDVFDEVKNVMNSHSDYEQLSKNDKLKESIKFVDGMLKSAKQMKQEEQAG